MLRLLQPAFRQRQPLRAMLFARTKCVTKSTTANVGPFLRCMTVLSQHTESMPLSHEEVMQVNTGEEMRSETYKTRSKVKARFRRVMSTCELVVVVNPHGISDTHVHSAEETSLSSSISELRMIDNSNTWLKRAIPLSLAARLSTCIRFVLCKRKRFFQQIVHIINCRHMCCRVAVILLCVCVCFSAPHIQCLYNKPIIPPCLTYNKEANFAKNVRFESYEKCVSLWSLEVLLDTLDICSHRQHYLSRKRRQLDTW